jgi:hypothetical protein
MKLHKTPSMAVEKFMSQNAMPFRLCDLPAEVRDLIYTRMISDRNSTEYRKSTIDLGIRPFFNHFAYNASVQATNHQVRREFARCLCIKHDKLVGQPVTVAVSEISINYYTDLPPHFDVDQLCQIAPFVQFLRKIDVKMDLKSESSNIFTPLPSENRITTIEYLILALQPVQHLRSIRIHLVLFVAHA